MSERGFTDTAIESAHAFRAIMEAMAHPGRVLELPTSVVPPVPLTAEAATVALTLCDFQTPIWLAPKYQTEAITRYLRFHTGAPLAGSPAEAQFACLSVEDDIPPFRDFFSGTHEYPDRSATLIIQAPSLRGSRRVDLSGPGLGSTTAFGVDGLDWSFWRALAVNHGRYPVGIDVIFVGPASVAALPRSTSIHIREAA
jgi:alpha-D-ribose 1-methylphosphonate 5-triphosphate synthase subunit PhnH